MYNFATLSPIATFIYLVFLWGDIMSQLSTRLKKIRKKEDLLKYNLLHSVLQVDQILLVGKMGLDFQIMII